MLPYHPNPMTREGQEYELLEQLHRNTLQTAAAAETEVARLRAAMREIAFEVSAVGCERADDAICIETNRAKEDWCPYCRIGTIVRDAS